MKVDRWIQNFKSLTVENQLKVIKAINEEFGDYAFNVEDKKFNLINFFQYFVNSIDDLEKLKGIKETLKRFDKLPYERRIKVIESFAKSISRHEQLEEQSQKEETCKNEGHDFDDWNERTWTTREVYWDAGPQGYVNVEHHEWSRCCKRCGYFEKIGAEPAELKEARLKREKEEEIKKLELKLKQLKGE